MDWSQLAATIPDAASFTAITAARPTQLAPNELVDLIVTTEKLISHLHAMQIGAVAEFARPGRAGDLTGLIDMLTEKGGQAKLPDGTINIDALEVLVNEEAQRMAAAEIAAALHQSPRGAAHRITTALEMVDQLPATLTALRDGRIDKARAAVIAERTHLLDPQLRPAVEAAAVELAATRTPGQSKPMIDRRVIAADPDAARKRTQQAHAHRSVTRQVGDDGMGVIKATLPAEGAVSVYELLDSIARAAAAAHDDRPIGALRADALIDICIALLTDGHVDVRPMTTRSNNTHPGQPDTPPADEAGTYHQAGRADEAGGDHEAGRADEAGGDHGPAAHDKSATAQDPAVQTADTGTQAAGTPRPPLTRVMTHHGRAAHLNLTMSATTLAAYADHPAELAGHGAITADTARMIAASIASLTVIAVNDHGHATAVGATTYPPRQTTRDHVTAANPTCRFPACRQPARLCELDHRDPFNHTHPAAGGPTDPANLDPLCKNNHLLKTHTDWTATTNPADSLTLDWTSPTGHHYPDHPHEHALPGQDQQRHDQRPCDATCSSHHPADGGANFGTSPADQEHAAACAQPAPTPEPDPPPTIADVTAQYLRTHIQHQDHKTTRDRIQQIIQRHWARHDPPDPATAHPAPRLFGKHVITPIGTTETTLHQLISAAAAARQQQTNTDPDQPPF
jgi:hypothetical protein